MDSESSNHLTDEIRQMLAARLSAYNQGRPTEAGSYLIVAPREHSLYYSLWRHYPAAAYHPYVFLNNLELNALGSLESAIRTISNSFLPLEWSDQPVSPPDNGDDILLFGKYRGYHLWDIYNIDPRYVQWIAEKFVAKTRNEARFLDLAVTYNKVWIDLHTRKSFKVAPNRCVGSVGDKLTHLQLRVLHVRCEDDSYKTRTMDGTTHYYVDQLITAVDADNNRFYLIIKAADRSLNSQVVATGSHLYTTGEIIHLDSAKILKQYLSHNIPYTRLGYLKFR